MENKVLRYDFDVLNDDGSDSLTSTIRNLLNSYPALKSSEAIEFQVLDSVKGIAMFPSPSVAVISEVVDITSHVEQSCSYTFVVVYRTRGTDREFVKEWLDNLGRWLEQQTIEVDETEWKLQNYPALPQGMEFTSIARTSQSYLDSTTADKAEDWAITIQALYRNEYDK